MSLFVCNRGGLLSSPLLSRCSRRRRCRFSTEEGGREGGKRSGLAFSPFDRGRPPPVAVVRPAVVAVGVGRSVAVGRSRARARGCLSLALSLALLHLERNLAAAIAIAGGGGLFSEWRLGGRTRRVSGRTAREREWGEGEKRALSYWAVSQSHSGRAAALEGPPRVGDGGVIQTTSQSAARPIAAAPVPWSLITCVQS